MIATFRVAPKDSAAFEILISQVAALTHAHEPNTLLYRPCRSRTEPGCYKVLELFASQADLDAHMAATWLKDIGPALLALLIETPILELLDPIG